MDDFFVDEDNLPRIDTLFLACKHCEPWLRNATDQYAFKQGFKVEHYTIGSYSDEILITHVNDSCHIIKSLDELRGNTLLLSEDAGFFLKAFKEGNTSLPEKYTILTTRNTYSPEELVASYPSANLAVSFPEGSWRRVLEQESCCINTEEVAAHVRKHLIRELFEKGDAGILKEYGISVVQNPCRQPTWQGHYENRGNELLERRLEGFYVEGDNQVN